MTGVRRAETAGAAYYEYRHVVGAAETGIAGTVHEVSYGRWQGRCREMFVFEHVPALLDEIGAGVMELAVCGSGQVVFAGIGALDEVFVRMRVEELTLTQAGLVFDHLRLRQGTAELAVRGWQRVACTRRAGPGAVPAPLPEQLRRALRTYCVTGPGSGSSVTSH